MILYIILKENSTVYSIPSKDYYKECICFLHYTWFSIKVNLLPSAF